LKSYLIPSIEHLSHTGRLFGTVIAPKATSKYFDKHVRMLLVAFPPYSDNAILSLQIGPALPALPATGVWYTHLVEKIDEGWEIVDD